jgi:hypothetical protein
MSYTEVRRLARAGLLSVGLWLPLAAAAQVEVQDVAEAAAIAQGTQEDPDCVTEAVTSQVVAEGARQVGAAAGKLLGKLGLKSNAPATASRTAAANPCKPKAAAQGGAVPAVPAPAPAAAAVPAAPKFSFGKPATGGRNCGALGAGCADGMKPLVACMDEKNGWLWKVLADAVEEKRDRTGLSGQQRVDIDADIAALRAAHAAGARRVEPVDPARPERYNSWLTPEEYSVAATHASQTINEHTQECNRKYAKF